MRLKRDMLANLSPAVKRLNDDKLGLLKNLNEVKKTTKTSGRQSFTKNIAQMMRAEAIERPTTGRPDSVELLLPIRLETLQQRRFNDWREKSKYKNRLYDALMFALGRSVVGRNGWRWAPYQKARLEVVRIDDITKKIDQRNLFYAVKPLEDFLQIPHPTLNPRGIGMLVSDDTKHLETPLVDIEDVNGGTPGTRVIVTNLLCGE